MNFDNHCEKFLMSTAHGATIKEYSYEIKHGLINFPRHHIVPIAFHW